MKKILSGVVLLAIEAAAQQAKPPRVIDLGASSLEAHVKAPDFTWIESHQKFKEAEEQLILQRLGELELHFVQVLQKGEEPHVGP